MTLRGRGAGACAYEPQRLRPSRAKRGRRHHLCPGTHSTGVVAFVSLMAQPADLHLRKSRVAVAEAASL